MKGNNLKSRLKYRFPEASKVALEGRFVKSENHNAARGFVLSNFTGNELFVFEEGDQDDFSFKLDFPYPISIDEYNSVASQAIDEMVNGDTSKIVLSRVKEVREEVSPDALFDLLCDLYPNAFVYCAVSPLFGVWIGATPEVLLSAENGKSSTMSLAGTLKGEQVWTKKEEEEQAYVTDFIQSKLKKGGAENVHIHEREEINAGPVRHLLNRIDFSFDQSNIMSLVKRLHPTPAVSGVPQEKAIDFILENEKHERSLYSGIVGVINDRSSKLYVNLRCAQLFSDRLFLYLGGGLTKDSNVEMEWQETENKAKTLLNAIEQLRKSEC